MAKAAKQGLALGVERMSDHEWRFRYPRLHGEVLERFHAVLESMDQGESGKVLGPLRQLVKEFPEFLDARHHLAIALDRDPQMAFMATHEWRSAVRMGLDALPPDFVMGRDLLEWGWLDNRPFLRACHGLALDCLANGHTGEALAICHDLLDLNPGDNQGVRSLVVSCLFERRRPAEVLAICDRYPDDGMPALLFGRVLALFMLDRRKEAVAALVTAAEYSPLVARELTKKTHHAPRNHYPGFVTMGGADEAFYYWREAGDFWKRTPGALAFVRETLGKKEAHG